MHRFKLTKYQNNLVSKNKLFWIVKVSLDFLYRNGKSTQIKFVDIVMLVHFNFQTYYSIDKMHANCIVSAKAQIMNY